MRHNLRNKKHRPMAEINVVPYIDVMLVLLVIFMITAPLLTQGVHVDLPKAQTQSLTRNQEPIIVSVDADGKYYLNVAVNPSQPITKEILQQRVAAELQTGKSNGKERPVFVKGDRKVDYGAVVQAMVLLKNAGAQSVGLVTEDENK